MQPRDTGAQKLVISDAHEGIKAAAKAAKQVRMRGQSRREETSVPLKETEHDRVAG